MQPKYRLSDCPYQTGKTTLICEACRRLMVPSADEVNKYCESGDFKDCPYYREAIKREGRKPSQ